MEGKETLFRLYVTENRTQTEVGDILGVSQHVIWKALKKMGTMEMASGTIKFDKNGDVHKQMTMRKLP